MAENQKDRVEIELVADDQASESLKRIQEALEKMNETHEKGPFGKEGAKEGAEKFSWMEAFKIEAVHEGIDKLKEMFGELSKAGAEQDRNARSITGILSMTDKTGQGYDSLLQKGRLFEEELHKTSIEAGVAQDKIVSAFDMIMERSGKSAEATNKITRQMAIASAAVPGGIDELARGFAMMEQGMVRARNPLVQFIATTSELKGGAQAVALAMQHMTASQRDKYALEAIEKMATKMEKAAPSFDSVVTSLHAFKEGMIEDVGSGLLRDLVPRLNDVLGILKHNEDKITKSAKEFGNWLAQQFDQIWDAGRQAFDDMQTDTMTIQAALKDAGHFLTDAFSGGVLIAGKVAEIMSHAYQGGQIAVAKIKDAIASVSPGGHTGYLKEYERDTAMEAAHAKGVNWQAGFGYGSAANETIQKLMRESPEAAKYFGSTDWRAMTAKNYNNTQAEAVKYGYQFNPTADPRLAGGGDEQMSGDFTKAIGHAQQDHNEAMEKYGALVILQNDKFAEELIKAGDKTGIAWTHVIDNLKDLQGIIPDVTKEKIEDLEKKIRTGPGTAGSGPIFNINHMTIHQDFRDMDPERVAIVFQRDLSKAAMNRTQSMMSGAFHP